jgi:hypothetical protein
MTTLHAFLLGIAVAWLPGVLMIGWLFLRRDGDSLRDRDGRPSVR